MKPCILTYTALFSATGGAQFTMSLLAQELASRGYQNVYFTRPPFTPEHRYSRMIAAAGIPVRVLPRFYTSGLARVAEGLFSLSGVIPYALVRRRSPAYAWRACRSIFQTWLAGLEERSIKKQFTREAERARREGRPVILHIWGPAMLTPMLLRWASENNVPSIYHEMGEADEAYIKMFTMEGTVEAVNLADLVICVSPSVTEKMRTVFGYRGKIETIYDMIIDPGDDWVKGRKLDGKVTFGAIGRLVPHKRHSDLLHAVKALRQEQYDVELVIASDGPMYQPLRNLAKELGIDGHVHFLGEFENLEEVMARFDVFTLTSTSESQCMPVTESMAYGKPVIVSRFGGIPDFVEDGVTGILLPLEDLPSLIAAMKRLAGDAALREEMGRRGRERFLEFFTPEKVGDRVESAYAELLAAHEAKHQKAKLPVTV